MFYSNIKKWGNNKYDISWGSINLNIYYKDIKDQKTGEIYNIILHKAHYFK